MVWQTIAKLALVIGPRFHRDAGVYRNSLACSKSHEPQACKDSSCELVLTSGQMLLRKEDMPERGLFLSKPYDPSELVEMVRSLAV
jgi:hypothetical protein